MISILPLIFSMLLSNQSKPVTVLSNSKGTYNYYKVCQREGDKECVSVLGETVDIHGCQPFYGFVWDEGSQACTTEIFVRKQPAVVTCSPLGKPDSNGDQRGVCWYKPVEPKN